VYKDKLTEAKSHLLEATRILNSLIGEDSQAFELEDYMKLRVELWSRIFNLGSIVSKDKLHEIWVTVMHKDVRGLGGFFTGNNPSLMNVPPEKVALTQAAADTIKEWTGQDISDFAKRYK